MQTLLSGDLGYIKDDKIFELQSDIGKVERMLKALIKSFENKHLNPGILESLTPFSQLIGRRAFDQGFPVSSPNISLRTMFAW
jgi:hypothetical protein